MYNSYRINSYHKTIWGKCLSYDPMTKILSSKTKTDIYPPRDP